MEDHIPIRPVRSLLSGRQTSNLNQNGLYGTWSSMKIYSTCILCIYTLYFSQQNQKKTLNSSVANGFKVKEQTKLVNASLHEKKHNGINFKNKDKEQDFNPNINHEKKKTPVERNGKIPSNGIQTVSEKGFT